MAKLTLAQQLAAIAEPAPVDFDPEDAFAASGRARVGGGAGSEDEADGGAKAAEERDRAARAEYVEVGQSKLRKRGEAVLDPKYGGKKSSRAALYGDDESASGGEEDDVMASGSDGENDAMDAELAGLLDAGDDYESEEDAEGFEDLEAGSGSGEGEGEDDEDEEDSEDEEDEAPTQAASSAAMGAKGEKPRISKDDRAMMKQLKQAASADVEKGRDVKKQLAFADTLLSSRIAIQKAVQASNSLPTPASVPPAKEWFAASSEVRVEVDDLWRELIGCSEELFELRTSLLSANESLTLPSSFGESRKRKRVDAEDGDKVAREEWMADTLKELGEVETLTVTKWSDKVLAASGLLAKSQKSFKAVNQNAMSQIDHALSATGERERLVKRTRVRRTNEGLGAEVLGRNVATAPIEEEGGKRTTEVECFDDSDWYAQVLRDVVESRMLDLDDATLTSLRTASAYARGGKKQKKVVDTRASKGRKIRYHVHEKAQNWMIPVEAGHWHDEQIDELFASLLGRSFPQGSSADGKVAADGINKLDPALDDVAGQKAGQIEVGSLRLFG
ncbi:rRNA-processing protein bfr2 [Rhodosporidiobolus nylandii]